MTHVNRFKVRLMHSDEGVAVSCPALPGCWSQGATEEEALENIADAIREYLAVGDATTAFDDTAHGVETLAHEARGEYAQGKTIALEQIRDAADRH